MPKMKVIMVLVFESSPISCSIFLPFTPWDHHHHKVPREEWQIVIEFGIIESNGRGHERHLIARKNSFLFSSGHHHRISSGRPSSLPSYLIWVASGQVSFSNPTFSLLFASPNRRLNAPTMDKRVFIYITKSGFCPPPIFLELKLRSICW